MLKYYSSAVVFQEIPDEITLAIEITGCPHRCQDCHSPWLREDIGEPLTPSVLLDLVKQHPDISCVCFMGGDASHSYICYLADVLRLNAPHLKIAMYSGDDKVNKVFFRVLDYYKVGSYQPEKGPINQESTNQRLYIINRENETVTDITDKFWHKL